jgi:hypothetical protein
MTSLSVKWAAFGVSGHVPGSRAGGGPDWCAACRGGAVDLRERLMGTRHDVRRS